MTLMLNPRYCYEDYKKVINYYEFPIFDLDTAVKFLNELPKECNVDLRGRRSYCNLECAQSVDSEYNLMAILNNHIGDKLYNYKVHIMFQCIDIIKVQGILFVIVRSGKEDNESEIYLNNEIMVLNPTTDYVYEMIFNTEL